MVINLDFPRNLIRRIKRLYPFLSTSFQGLPPDTRKIVIFLHVAKKEALLHVKDHLDNEALDLLITIRHLNYFDKYFLADALGITNDDADAIIQRLFSSGFVEQKTDLPAIAQKANRRKFYMPTEFTINLVDSILLRARFFYEEATKSFKLTNFVAPKKEKEDARN